MADLIKVGMADFKVSRSPATIISYGLGSCIGVSLYDPQTKIGGLLHIMLPDSKQSRATDNPAKFADTGIPLMLDEVLKMGASRSRLVAKMAGGAQMFAFSGENAMLRIGERNVEATKKKLDEFGIRIIAEDTGNSYGRTIEFYPETGELLIKSVGKEQKII